MQKRMFFQQDCCTVGIDEQGAGAVKSFILIKKGIMDIIINHFVMDVEKKLFKKL